MNFRFPLRAGLFLPGPANSDLHSAERTRSGKRKVSRPGAGRPKTNHIPRFSGEERKTSPWTALMRWLWRKPRRPFPQSVQKYLNTIDGAESRSPYSLETLKTLLKRPQTTLANGAINEEELLSAIETIENHLLDQGTSCGALEAAQIQKRVEALHLESGLKHPSPLVRQHSARHLCGNRVATDHRILSEALRNMLEMERDIGVIAMLQAGVLESGRKRSDSLAFFERGLTHPKVEIRQVSVRGVNLNCKPVIDLHKPWLGRMFELLGDETEPRAIRILQHAIAGYAKRENRVVFLKYLASEDPLVKKTAIGCLGKMGEFDTLFERFLMEAGEGRFENLDGAYETALAKCVNAKHLLKLHRELERNDERIMRMAFALMFRLEKRVIS